MIKATDEFMKQNEALYEKRKNEILNASDNLKIIGNVFYVSNSGDDSNDGKSPDSPWKSLERVTNADLNPGDGVLFKRGDLFRGNFFAKSNVSYGAYGVGDKPKFYAGDRDYADPALWTEVNPEKHIWKCTEKMLDAGTLVFNHGEAHSRKLIPTFKDMKFVCRDNEDEIFDINIHMTNDLDLYWHQAETLTTEESRGKTFPVPEVVDTLGELYLRCDKGNPGEVFDSIESLARRHMIRASNTTGVKIDNLCMKYIGMHAVAADGYVVGLHVTNCEIGWIGGCIQHYFGTDPNYPQGDRGSVTRFGNGVEIYGGCDDFVVTGCYVYEVYDAGMTHQITTDRKITMTNIRYADNLIEKCVYGIEYFLDQIDGESESYMDNIVIDTNIILLSGYGWGQQRHNTHTPALIKGWSYVNTARNYSIKNNIFDRCAYRMLHLVAQNEASCPEMSGNTFIQYLGGMIGQYGANEAGEPDMLMFDENAETKINEVFGDKSAKVYYIES